MQDPRTKVHFMCVWLHSLSNVLVHVRLTPELNAPTPFVNILPQVFSYRYVIETLPTFCSKISTHFACPVAVHHEKLTVCGDKSSDGDFRVFTTTLLPVAQVFVFSECRATGSFVEPRVQCCRLPAELAVKPLWGFVPSLPQWRKNA